MGLRDFFYFKEHLFIVCELLGLNLYEFQKEVTEAGHPNYFTLPRLQVLSLSSVSLCLPCSLY